VFSNLNGNKIYIPRKALPACSDIVPINENALRLQIIDEGNVAITKKFHRRGIQDHYRSRDTQSRIPHK